MQGQGHEPGLRDAGEIERLEDGSGVGGGGGFINEGIAELIVINAGVEGPGDGGISVVWGNNRRDRGGEYETVRGAGKRGGSKGSAPLENEIGGGAGVRMCRAAIAEYSLSRCYVRERVRFGDGISGHFDGVIAMGESAVCVPHRPAGDAWGTTEPKNEDGIRARGTRECQRNDDECRDTGPLLQQVPGTGHQGNFIHEAFLSLRTKVYWSQDKSILGSLVLSMMNYVRGERILTQGELNERVFDEHVLFLLKVSHSQNGITH